MPKIPVVLMADDSKEDQILLRRAFGKAGVLNPIIEVDSGKNVIRYLSGQDEYMDRVRYPLPSVLLLDLKMPDIDGFEVLRWIRDKHPVSGLLVVVLSRLDEIKNINLAYQLGAHSFLAKPGDPKDLQQLINSFSDYWLLRNRPPAPTPDEKPRSQSQVRAPSVFSY